MTVIWVTGAHGFIGRYLARMLADQGHHVSGIGHGAIDETDQQRIGLAKWLNGEIDDANLNALAGRSGLPSTVFHLAGGSSVGLSIVQPLEDFSRLFIARRDCWNGCAAQRQTAG